jgi:hypothetical protein
MVEVVIMVAMTMLALVVSSTIVLTIMAFLPSWSSFSPEASTGCHRGQQNKDQP